MRPYSCVPSDERSVECGLYVRYVRCGRMLKSKEAEFEKIKQRAERAEVKARDTWLRAQIQLGKVGRDTV